MEPAASIIKHLGGAKKVASILGVALNACYRWQYPEEKGGTGGEIPRKYRARLIAHASTMGIPLTNSSFAAVGSDADSSHDVILKTRTSEDCG